MTRLRFTPTRGDDLVDEYPYAVIHYGCGKPARYAMDDPVLALADRSMKVDGTHPIVGEYITCSSCGARIDSTVTRVEKRQRDHRVAPNAR